MSYSTYKNHSDEPKQTCPMIDSVISTINTSMKEAEEISNYSEDESAITLADSIKEDLSYLEDEMESIRDINSTLREQREYYKNKVDEIEGILND